MKKFIFFAALVGTTALLNAQSYPGNQGFQGSQGYQGGGSYGDTTTNSGYTSPNSTFSNPNSTYKTPTYTTPNTTTYPSQMGGGQSSYYSSPNTNSNFSSPNSTFSNPNSTYTSPNSTFSNPNSTFSNPNTTTYPSQTGGGQNGYYPQSTQPGGFTSPNTNSQFNAQPGNTNQWNTNTNPQSSSSRNIDNDSSYRYASPKGYMAEQTTPTTSSWSSDTGTTVNQNQYKNNKFPQDFAATATDQELNAKIRHKLKGGWFSKGYNGSIALKTTNGSVVIQGTVDKADDIQKITDEIKKVDGVMGINNQLSVKNK